MQTKTNKEFTEMNKREIKKIFDFFLKAYEETSTRVAYAYPQWLEEFNNDIKEAKTTFVAIQASLAMMAGYERNRLIEWAKGFETHQGSDVLEKDGAD
jgi:hypothetical protein